MKRDLYIKLLQWKENAERKPLILNGARQVGKTWLLRKFGQAEYEKMAFFSLDRDTMAARVFEKGASVADILLSLSAISNVDITLAHTL